CRTDSVRQSSSLARPDPYVLVVDDFPDAREMLAAYLAHRGFWVAAATDGATALLMARRRPPRIILMDITMPGIDGWEAIRQLKADPRTKDGIVIAMVAHASQPDEAIARDAECDGFVCKPYELAVLVGALETVMQRGRPALAAL